MLVEIMKSREGVDGEEEKENEKYMVVRKKKSNELILPFILIMCLSSSHLCD